MKTPFKTNHNCKPEQGAINDGPIITTPDHSVSMRELVARTQRGIPLPSQRVPVYNEEYVLPDLKGLDLTEIDEIKRNQAQNVENHKQILKGIEKEIKRRKTNDETKNSVETSKTPDVE